MMLICRRCKKIMEEQPAKVSLDFRCKSSAELFPGLECPKCGSRNFQIHFENKPSQDIRKDMGKGKR